MQWYFRALTAVGIFSMLSGSIVQLRLFKEMSPTTMVTSMAVVSLFMTSLSYMLRKEQVVVWVLKHKYLIVKTELILGLAISVGMLYYGVSSKTLVARWVLAMTVMEALNMSFKFLFEKVKEQRGDGSYIAATKDMHTTFGYLCGNVLAVVVIQLYPDINQDVLVYMHGPIMTLGTLGLWVCLREHDRRINIGLTEEV